MASILYVASFPPRRGGGALSAAQIATGLGERGHEMTLLGPITPEAATRPDEFARASQGVRVERFVVPHLQDDPYQTCDIGYLELQAKRIGERVRALCERTTPDLLIAGNERLLVGMPALARTLGIPCLALSRGIMCAVLDGRFDPASSRRLLDEMARADMIIAVAEHLAARLRARGLQRVHAIANGLDPARICPGPRSAELCSALRIDAGARVILHASNLKSVKRPLDVVASAEKALRAEPDLVYVVVGDGVGREAVERATASAGISRSFRFAGWVAPEQIPDYLRLADLVVQPSQSEGMSRVLLEAQACGVPVLASDIPASRELVEDGVSGCLFELADVDAIARRTLELIGDPELRAAIGANARERVLREHRIDDALVRYDQAIESLAAG